MRLNEKEIENIICNSVTENLICRALELRPGELAKFICGLANVNGGYILVGVEMCIRDRHRNEIMDL